jgi:hypothetical protein
MRRIAIFREGNMMGALIGPDLVVGIGGFGKTVPRALRDLADAFDTHGYALPGNRVVTQVADSTITATARPGAKPSDAIRRLAAMIEERGYAEQEFPEPDWSKIGSEEPVRSASSN